MWVVTREAAEGQPLVDALKKRGHEAVCVPAIKREPLPWPEDLRPFGEGMMFLTSPYAARLAWKNLDHAAVPPVRWAAVEPATSKVVAGWAVVDVSAPGGSMGLAEAVIATPRVPTRLFWPTSDAGLASDEHKSVEKRLRDAGFSVNSRAVYTTIPDVHLDDNLRLLQRRVRFHAVLFSPSAARALHDALARTGVTGLARVVTVGASTARAWASKSAQASQVSQPTEAPPGVDIADFVCSLEKP